MLSSSKASRISAVLVAGSIAAFAGSASAQFVAETSETQPSKVNLVASGQTDEQTIVMTTGDGKSYKVSILNGEVIKAWANGDPVDVAMVRKDDEGIYFLDSQGNVQETIRLAIPGAPANPIVTGFPLQPTPPRGPGAAPAFPGDPAGSFEVTVGVKLPPVMLGINLSEPSDALRAQLGLGDLKAILVDDVFDGLPAAKAGLKKYDIIVSLDGSEGSSGATLSKVLAEKEPGDTLEIHVLRAGKKIELSAELVAYDAKALGQEQFGFFDERPRFPGIITRRGGDQDMKVWIDRGSGKLELLDKQGAQRAEEVERLLQERLTVREQVAAEEKMRAKVAEAMREAERRVLELRDGQLFVREADEAAERAASEINELRQRFARQLPEIEEELEDRLAEIEERFDVIERRFDEQAEQLGDRMERLMELMERMADRMERAFDED